MQTAKIILWILSLLGFCVLAQSISSQTTAQPPAKSKRIVIAASTVLDGKGRVLHNTRIVIEGSKIVAIRSKGRAGGL